MLSEIIDRNILQVVIFCIFVNFPCKAVKILRVITRNKYDFSRYFFLELIFPSFLLSQLFRSSADNQPTSCGGWLCGLNYYNSACSDWLLSGHYGKSPEIEFLKNISK